MKHGGWVWVLIAVAALPVGAAWFGGGEKEKTKEAPPVTVAAAGGESVHRVLSAADGEAFLRLVRARQEIEEQQRVIDSLLDEKRQEFAAFGESLRVNYGIALTNVYQYVRDEHLIYRVEGGTNAPAADVPAVATNQVAEAGLQRTVQSRLSEQEAGAFEKLLTAKQITRQQMAALELLRREKRMEHDRALQTLSERFGIDAGRHYRYDLARRTVFLKAGKAGGGRTGAK